MAGTTGRITRATGVKRRSASLMLCGLCVAAVTMHGCVRVTFIGDLPTPASLAGTLGTFSWKFSTKGFSLEVRTDTWYSVEQQGGTRDPVEASNLSEIAYTVTLVMKSKSERTVFFDPNSVAVTTRAGVSLRPICMAFGKRGVELVCAEPLTERAQRIVEEWLPEEAPALGVLKRRFAVGPPTVGELKTVPVSGETVLRLTFDEDRTGGRGGSLIIDGITIDGTKLTLPALELKRTERRVRDMMVY